jgi:predicted enzyme related to lactoylglutathione lyase
MKLAYGIFYTNNIDLIGKFYRETMAWGLAFGNDKFLAFKIGEALLGIKLKEHEREIPGHQTVIIEVDDVDSLYASLKSKGVTIYKEVTQESWGKNFAILDPDSNKVEFFRNK